jgi:hypothetical protein
VATFFHSSVAGEAIAGDAIAAVVPKQVILTNSFLLNLSYGILEKDASSAIPLTGFPLALSRGTIAVQLDAVVNLQTAGLLQLARGDIFVDIPLNQEIQLKGNLLRIVQNPITVLNNEVYHTPHFVEFVLQMFKIILP